MFLRQETREHPEIVSWAIALIAATLVFLAFYWLGQLIHHDKPAAYIVALLASIWSLRSLRHRIKHQLLIRDRT